jgi:hypothetical protein
MGIEIIFRDAIAHLCLFLNLLSLCCTQKTHASDCEEEEFNNKTRMHE